MAELRDRLELIGNCFLPFRVFGENPLRKESLLMTAVMAEWLRTIKRNRLGYGARLASVAGWRNCSANIG